jgi:hypothetical protein
MPAVGQLKDPQTRFGPHRPQAQNVLVEVR